MLSSESPNPVTTAALPAVHVAGADIDYSGRARLAHWLRNAPRDVLVLDHPAWTDLPPDTRCVALPAGAAFRQTAAARRHAARLRLPNDQTVVHAWSRAAWPWIDAFVGGAGVALHAPAEPGRSPERDELARTALVWAAHVYCTSATQRGHLIAAGVPADRITVAAPAAGWAAGYAPPTDAPRDTADVRARLALDADDRVWLIPPPATPASGLFTAAWAAMLVAQVERRLRVVLPADDTAEFRRTWRLISACNHEWVFRAPPTGASWDELLRAAEGVLAAVPDAHHDALARASGQGVRIVTANAPHGRPPTPWQLAHALLAAFETTV